MHSWSKSLFGTLITAGDIYTIVMVISGASKSSLPDYKVSWTQGEYEDMSCLIENNSDDIEVQATAPPTQQPQTLPPVTVAEEADPKYG